MKRTTLALVVAAAVVLGLTLRWLVVARPPDDTPEPTPGRPAARGDATRGEDVLRILPVDPAQPLVDDLQESAKGLWGTLPLAACTGRVVDASGAPLEDVIVSAVPDGSVLLASGFAEESGLVPIWWAPTGPASAGRVALDALPSARSDAAGRFTIGVPYVSDPPARRDHSEGRTLPELLAHRDGNVPARRVCQGFGPRGCDVGDIVMPLAAAVVGRVVDETGHPIGGADIEVAIEGHLPVAGDDPLTSWLDPANHFRFERSGDDGRFRVSWLWPGTAQLSFDVASRLPAARTGIELAAGDETELGDIVLERGPTISGRVVDGDGRPIPGAEVRVSVHDFAWRDVDHPIHRELQVARWGRLVHTATFIGEREGRYGVTRSGDDGSFVLGGLTRDEYGLYAAADGWEPDSVLHVATGSDGISLQLRRQGRLRLRLLDDVTGAPLGDARPTVCRGTGKWFEEEDTLPVTVDPGSGRGVFIVDAVCPAPMAVVVESTSHGRQVARIEGLALGAPLEEREVRVPLGAAIAGLVVDETGAPLEGATVRLSPYDHDQALGLLPVEIIAESAADGRFEFAGLTPAHWSLSAQLASYRSRGSRPSVVVKAGETRSDLEFVMTRTGRVQGVVRDAEGHTVQGLMVAAKEDERSALAEGVTHTDSEGRYELEVRPGSYTVLVSLANSDNTIRRTIEVAANETIQADLTLPAPAVLSGRVLAASAPCVGAAVSLLGQGLNLNRTTDEHGEYRLVLPSGGEGELWARSPRGGLTPTRPVVVHAGESMVLDLEFGSLVCSGAVVDSVTGAGVAGAHVSFSRRRGPNHPNPAVTDADGRFFVGDVAPGEWRLIAQHDRYLGMAKWMRIDIVEGAEAPPIRLELTLGATVSGVVRTAAGAPTAQEFDVTAWREGESYAAADAQVESGHYEIIRLETGRYTLLVTRVSEWWEDFDRQDRVSIAKVRATVDVVAGQALSLDLSLPPGER